MVAPDRLRNAPLACPRAHGRAAGLARVVQSFCTGPSRLLLESLPFRVVEADRRRAASVLLADTGHGWDVFGADRGGVAVGLAATRFLYERWFRVTSHGIHHIPKRGPAVLASNHGGTLPYDALMIWADVVRGTEPPRVPRPVMDDFVLRLPFLGTLFVRAGAVGGSRANLHALLEAGEVLLVFPEGTRGIGKPFRDRYQLQSWRVGHAELAIRHRAPIIPVAVVGAEEQMPQIARLPFKAFGAPYVPIPLVPLPLPVHYHIHYGPPIDLHERYPVEAADDPAAVRSAADEVAAAVEALLGRGLVEREGVFR